MPSRVESTSGSPELPEDPTGKATLKISATGDHKRQINLGMAVSGRDSVACIRVAVAGLMGTAGPALTLYFGHVSAYPAEWVAAIAGGQLVVAVLGVWPHHDQNEVRK